MYSGALARAVTVYRDSHESKVLRFAIETMLLDDVGQEYSVYLRHNHIVDELLLTRIPEPTFDFFGVPPTITYACSLQPSPTIILQVRGPYGMMTVDKYTAPIR